MVVPPTPDSIRAFLKTHGLSQRKLAALVPCDSTTIERYLNKTRKIPTYFRRILNDIARELAASGGAFHGDDGRPD
jgi:transcriptional regulator with XRE-family HTH domain